jgi:hypothetical protein
MRSSTPILKRTATLVWAVIVVVIASGSGTYWTLRGVQHINVVAEGRGTVYQPHVSCTGALGRRTCTDDVRLYIAAKNSTRSLSDVRGLYYVAKSNPGQQFPVKEVYVDTTNDQVQRVVYSGTAYIIETTQHSFLVIGIVVLVIDAIAIGFLVWLVRYRRRAVGD